MGNFYVNYTVAWSSPKDVARALTGREALVVPAENGCVVAFERESDSQDSTVVSGLASYLSVALGSPVRAVVNHDDDILSYELHDTGKLIDEYDSTPGYFDPTASPSPPAGGDAVKLCEAFKSNNVSGVDRVLRKSSFDDDGYVFASERHEALILAAGLSKYALGTAFASFERGELPDGLRESDLLHSP